MEPRIKKEPLLSDADYETIAEHHMRLCGWHGRRFPKKMKTAKLNGDGRPHKKRGHTAEPRNKHIRYRQKNRNAGLCAICGKPSAPFYYCEWHRRKKNSDRLIGKIMKGKKVRFKADSAEDEKQIEMPRAAKKGVVSTKKPKAKKEPQTTLEELRKALRKSDPILSEDSDTFRVALILISSGVVGPNQHEIARFTKLPRAFIKKPAARLRKYGIWSGSKIRCEWFNEEYGDVAFWMDVCVAEGEVERREIEVNNKIECQYQSLQSK